MEVPLNVIICQGTYLYFFDGGIILIIDFNCREEKAQHRHSVEVANTGAYLNIRPSTLETLTKSGNSSVYNRRYRKTSGDDSTGDGSKLRTAPNSVTVLPPSLRCLLYLWEQVCSQCIQVAHNGFQDNGSAISTPVRPPRSLKETSVDVAERDTKRNRKKKKGGCLINRFLRTFN